MKIASVADVKAKLSGYIKASESGPIVVTEKGKPIAMLLAVHAEEEIERMILAYAPKFQRILLCPAPLLPLPLSSPSPLRFLSGP